MTLLLEDRQSTTRLETKDFFESIILVTLERLGIDDTVEISLTLTDNNDIRVLNRDHRGLDQITDVLSFPLLQLDMGDITKMSLAGDKNPDTGEIILGDIVISTEMAITQAQEYGHSVKRELGFLMVHGLLHLLGYNHEVDNESESLMFSLQEDILNRLELTRAEQRT